MNLLKKDLDYLNNIFNSKKKSSSGDDNPDDIIYFLYNKFLLCNDNHLFNLMMARQKIIQHIIDQNLPGNFLEFGIMKGAFSFQIIKTLLMNGLNKELYLFDFFEDNISMSSDIEKKQISEIYERIDYKRKSTDEIYSYAKDLGFNNLICIKGNIEKTINPFLEKNNSKFCFVYIDVDVENPTYVCLINIWDRVVKNGIIIIDDYNSKKWGPFQKIDDFLKDKNVEITHLHNSLKEGICIRKL